MIARLLFAAMLAVSLAACSTEAVREPADAGKSAELNAELGLRYMLQGKNDLAMEKLRRALQYQADYAPAHHYMAELYRRLEQADEAEVHYVAALDAAPDDSALRNNYAVFLCTEGRYEAAENQFVEVLKNPVYNARAQVYENLGLCLREKPDRVRAAFYFGQALRLEPKLPKSLLAMAQLSYRDGAVRGARDYLKRYLEVAPHTPETLRLGIRIERELGDRNAVASYGMLLEGTFPDSEEARWYRESKELIQR